MQRRAGMKYIVTLITIVGLLLSGSILSSPNKNPVVAEVRIELPGEGSKYYFYEATITSIVNHSPLKPGDNIVLVADQSVELPIASPFHVILTRYSRDGKYHRYWRVVSLISPEKHGR